MFSGQAASRCSKAYLYKVWHETSKNRPRGTNIKLILTPKIGCILKPSNYNAKPWFLHITAQTPQCLRRFWELDPKRLHACLVCPCRVFYEWVCVLSRKMWGFLRPNYTFKSPIIWQKKRKTKQNNVIWRLSRGTLKTCAKLHGLTLRHWLLKKKIGLDAWTSLYCYHVFYEVPRWLVRVSKVERCYCGGWLPWTIMRGITVVADFCCTMQTVVTDYRGGVSCQCRFLLLYS